MNLSLRLPFTATFFLFLALSCSQKELPSDVEIREAVYGKDGGQIIRVLGQKQINLDESPEMETLVLFQSGTSEVLAAFRKEGSSWTFLWRLEYFLQNLGPMFYDAKLKSWVSGSAPGKEKIPLLGIVFAGL